MRGAKAAQKYIVCNADEGDSGTFSDRLVMESDPYVLIEGMIIAGIVTGATLGYIYVRSEYPHSIATLEAAIDNARATPAGSATACSARRTRFELDVAKGAGAYVCGEETALLESLEGKRGIVRAKPPVPALVGLFGQPTVINNVITLATVPIIFARGAAFYKDFGMGRSRGTLPFQLAGNVKQGGLVELAFGVTLRELLYDYGGGTASGRPARAVQVGGPLGTYLPESQWDIPLDYEAYAAVGAVVGHGGIVVHDDTSNLAELAQYAMHFCALESCGKCTPCRIGSTRGVEVIATDSQRRYVDAASAIAARPVRHDGVRFALRDGRHDALPGAVRTRPFPRRLRSRQRRPAQSGGGLTMEPTMSDVLNSPAGGCGSGNCACKIAGTGATARDPLALRRHRLRHAAAPCGCRRDARNRRPGGDRAGRHFGDARGDRSRRERAEAVRHRFARTVRLVPPVSRRDRRQARLSGLVHDAR